MTDAEIETLKAGDIIVNRAGKDRTVLDVSHHRRAVYALVAILRCSWTHAPFTLLDRHQLRNHYQLVPGQVDPKSCRLLAAVINDRDKPGFERKLKCCDVVGKVR